MNSFIFPAWLNGKGGKALAGPIMIIMMLAMMILPLPGFALDIFFSFNIALAIIILLTSFYTVKPLDFMVFPTVLLVSTMLRLSLNVASTRVVLTEGHTGPDAAGKVIEAFGHFLIGGNYAVGIVVFIIITIINFSVVTKGAGRIAEVGARFALDAMPGKQMAIDADLNAGLIAEEEARRRRTEVAQEAEFYGAMDGASKYVKGDAVAGILVTVINVVGGLIVGMVQHDLGFAEASKIYTLLAIGDGLVAQIPSLIISTAAGIVVSRVASEEDIGNQFINQLFTKPEVMYITAAIIGGLGVIPGMPHVAFILLAGSLAGAGYMLKKRSQTAPSQEGVAAASAVPPAPEMEEATWQDILPVDTLGLEVGYRLIPLVDKNQGGELLRRIKGIRKKFAQDIGFLSPPVHIRDNLELKPSSYRIALKGVEIGSGDANMGQYLAIDPGMVSGTLPGIPTTDPAFGLPAVWIDASMREQAQSMGYTVVDAGTVIATHLNHLITSNATELLGRHEVQQLLDHVGKESPKLVEDLTPRLLSLSVIQKVLQNLLVEGVHIRDMRTIVETLTEFATQTQDANELTAQVRVALGRAIVQQIFPNGNELAVMTLDNKLERLLMQTLQGHGADGASMEPGLADTLALQTEVAAQHQQQLGLTPVLLVPGPLRALLARFLRRTLPQVKVLSHAELPENKTIRVTSLVGGQI
ncbi:flagellar biosynthesis protein FlhA [Undibacterium seohonense]|jgi:flagellar biosynthesis protein FlhA|uniref:Flagellar biosynthesis protein FlhA n=1 Tax=Undibacterium seohonense TaxID=1344950 RepID=A0ABR6X8H4_9BURK|nr:flagellar biosynthesis protein FlhA [Undibacterium seohonense]MBC3808681.1 flagellar biosynthesis protein FlhA [Undibacterium seohonense]